MDQIPVTFDYEGKSYSGTFSKVSGSGNTGTYHLMINNYYQGQLVYSDHYGWQFTSNKGLFKEAASLFGKYIEQFGYNDYV